MINDLDRNLEAILILTEKLATLSSNIGMGISIIIVFNVVIAIIICAILLEQKKWNEWR